jgi:hypothetical protein
LDQPAGERYPHIAPGHPAHRTDVDTDLLALFAKLCSRVPDASERADLLGVSPEVQAAWERGASLPLLRAHRKALERADRRVSRDAPAEHPPQDED